MLGFVTVVPAVSVYVWQIFA